MDGLLQFLEPQPGSVDPLTKKAIPPRGPAVIMSSQDFMGMKQDLEVACRLLGPKCTTQNQLQPKP